MVLQMIKRKKYHEILQTVSKSDLSNTIYDLILWCTFFLNQELEGRKMTVSRLGMAYHIHDIIGADLVEWSVLCCTQWDYMSIHVCVSVCSIPTTSGPLLRLVEDSQSKR